MKPNVAGTILALLTAVGGFTAGRNYSTKPDPSAAQQSTSGVHPAVTTAPLPLVAGKTGASAADDESRNSPARKLPDLEAAFKNLSHEMSEGQFDSDLVQLLAKWLAQDPESMVSWVMKDPAGSAILQRSMSEWTNADPTAASAWLAGKKDSPARDAAAAGLAEVVAGKDLHAATAWVRSIQSPVTRLAAIAKVGAEAYRLNDAEAATALAEMDAPASALPALTAEWQSHLSAACRRNAQNLVSVYGAATAAGAAIDASSLESIIAQLNSGVQGTGSFSTTKFQLRLGDLSPREKEFVTSMINTDRLAEGTLQYNPQE